MKKWIRLFGAVLALAMLLTSTYAEVEGDGAGEPAVTQQESASQAAPSDGGFRQSGDDAPAQTQASQAAQDDQSGAAMEAGEGDTPSPAVNSDANDTVGIDGAAFDRDDDVANAGEGTPPVDDDPDDGNDTADAPDDDENAADDRDDAHDADVDADLSNEEEEGNPDDSTDADDASALSLIINAESVELFAGDSFALEARVDGADAEVKSDEITFQTSDAAVAVVSDTGVVTAVAPGSAIIEARCGELSKQCAVTVHAAPSADRVILDQAQLVLGVGERAAINARACAADGSEMDARILYRTSDASVVTVQDGVIEAQKTGAAWITATSGGASARCRVVVMRAPTAIRLNASSVRLACDVGTGDCTSFQLSWTLSDASASAVTWYGYDPDVVRVSESGLVTAVGVGRTRVFAKTYNNRWTRVWVYVLPGPERVTLNHTALRLGEGDTFKLVPATNSGAYATYTFESNDPSVAGVDQDGNITAFGGGISQITVRAFNGATAVCEVAVFAAPTRVIVSPERLTLGVNERSAPLSVAFDTGDTGTGYRFATANAAIARVNGAGVVTGVRNGTTFIRVTAYNGVWADVPVTVYTEPQVVYLSPDTLTLEMGQSFTLTATCPNATSSFRYSSNDPDVAAVDEHGRVTGLSVGEAVITVRTFNNLRAYCAVRVIPPADRIDMDSEITIVAPLYTAFPINAFDADGAAYQGVIDVRVEPSGIVEYAAGRLLALREGSATLTATAGGVTATCRVTVVSYRSANEVKSIAHRGGAAYWPENTITAFQNAASTGADGIELDARSTKDGVQVVFHNAGFMIGKTAYYVSNLTYAQLKQLRPEVCTLDEALEVIAETGMELHLEMKETADGAKCVEIVRAHDMEDRTVYFSFYHPQLQQVYAVNPDAVLGMSLSAAQSDAVTAQLKDDLHLSFLVANMAITTQQQLDSWHRMGLKVCVWTVNNRADVRRFCNMGVDYVLSNNPDYCVQER